MLSSIGAAGFSPILLPLMAHVNETIFFEFTCFGVWSSSQEAMCERVAGAMFTIIFR